jgi:hypothetical protein
MLARLADELPQAAREKYNDKLIAIDLEASTAGVITPQSKALRITYSTLIVAARQDATFSSFSSLPAWWPLLVAPFGAFIDGW